MFSCCGKERYTMQIWLSDDDSWLTLVLLIKLIWHFNLLPSQFIQLTNFNNTVDSKGAWKAVQILVSWLHKKPADLDLHCFLKRIYPGSAGQGLKFKFFSNEITHRLKKQTRIKVDKDRHENINFQTIIHSIESCSTFFLVDALHPNQQ